MLVNPRAKKPKQWLVKIILLTMAFTISFSTQAYYEMEGLLGIVKVYTPSEAAWPNRLRPKSIVDFFKDGIQAARFCDREYGGDNLSYVLVNASGRGGWVCEIGMDR